MRGENHIFRFPMQPLSRSGIMMVRIVSSDYMAFCTSIMMIIVIQVVPSKNDCHSNQATKYDPRFSVFFPRSIYNDNYSDQFSVKD
jgi:hypothetical protein